MKNKILLEILNYKSTMIVNKGKTVDVIDAATGRWFTARSMRAAKWNASVWTRLCNEFKPVELTHE